MPTPLLLRMYHGESTVLAPAAQALLGLYATKTVLLTTKWAEGMPERDELRDPFLRTRDYRRFRMSSKPPDGTKVWLGKVASADPIREQQIVAAVPELTRSPQHPSELLLMPRGAVSTRSVTGIS